MHPASTVPGFGQAPKGFPFPLRHASPDTARPNTWKRLYNDPLPWRHDPSSCIRTHLPIDDLAHTTLPLLPSVGHLPARLTQLLQDDTPPAARGLVSWPMIKTKLKTALLADWRETRLPPGYYPYPLSLTPHGFMDLPKFLAGRIHQMRSGKSYLATHRTCLSDGPVDSTCPHCFSEEEDLSHAVLSCLPRAWAKTHFLPGVASLEQESPIWSSPALTVALAKFIKATATGFPNNMLPMGTDSPTLEAVFPPPPLSSHDPSRDPPTADPSLFIRAFAEA